MQNPTTDIEQMIKELNRLQLPGSLTDSFDAFREQAAAAVSREFSTSQLSWFLDPLNRFRGPEDRKDSLLDIFEPAMYTANHPAWEEPPGTVIELSALTSEVVAMAASDSGFAEVAREEIRNFREIAESFADEEMVGLGNIAGAVLADQRKSLRGREAAIRYVGLNASALLENLRAEDDTLWTKVPRRRVQFDDMVAKRKAELLAASARPPFQESDFACYSDNEIRVFVFVVRKIFLTKRARHLAICSRCRWRLEYWSGLVENFERSAPEQEGTADA